MLCRPIAASAATVIATGRPPAPQQRRGDRHGSDGAIGALACGRHDDELDRSDDESGRGEQPVDADRAEDRGPTDDAGDGRAPRRGGRVRQLDGGERIRRRRRRPRRLAVVAQHAEDAAHVGERRRAAPATSASRARAATWSPARRSRRNAPRRRRGSSARLGDRDLKIGCDPRPLVFGRVAGVARAMARRSCGLLRERALQQRLAARPAPDEQRAGDCGERQQRHRAEAAPPGRKRSASRRAPWRDRGAGSATTRRGGGRRRTARARARAASSPPRRRGRRPARPGPAAPARSPPRPAAAPGALHASGTVDGRQSDRADEPLATRVGSQQQLQLARRREHDRRRQIVSRSHCFTVTSTVVGVLVPDGEPVLLLEEETSARPLREDDARFATAADDNSGRAQHSGAMSLAQPAPRGVRLRLRPNVRRALLTVHIIAGVGLLGDVAAVLAINIRAATTSDPSLAAASYELLAMFTVLFGIPLSLISLATGILLGRSSTWGVCATRGSPPSSYCCSASSSSARSCSAPARTR